MQDYRLIHKIILKCLECWFLQVTTYLATKKPEKEPLTCAHHSFSALHLGMAEADSKGVMCFKYYLSLTHAHRERKRACVCQSISVELERNSSSECFLN